MKRKTLLSVGECMIEMSPLSNGEFHLSFAGDTLNTAWYARACLPDSSWDVSYFTRIGTDGFSEKMKAFLLKNNINIDYIEEDTVRQMGLYLIDINEGERSFTYWRNQSAARLLASDKELLERAFSNADVVYFSAITLAILSPEDRSVFTDSVHQARNKGKMTVFDTNIRVRLWEDMDTLRHVTMQAASAAQIILPSFEDEAAIFGDVSLEACAQRYRAVGVQTVVVKNGGGEMLVSDNNGETYFSDLARRTPVDTTGAGDSFNGGFLASLLSGKDITTAVKAGHFVASQVVMQRGAIVPVNINATEDTAG